MTAALISSHRGLVARVVGATRGGGIALPRPRVGAVRSAGHMMCPSRGSAVPSSSRRSPSSSSMSTFRGRGAAMAVSVATSLACSALSPKTSATALCEDKGGSGGGDDEDFISKIRSKMESQSLPDLLRDNDAVDAVLKSLGGTISSAISSGIPADVSYGFLAGYFSGLALKKAGKVASVTLGMSFLALQTLAYHGYVDVHHDKLQRQVGELLDRNNDGVVDGEDLKSVLEDVRRVAGFGLEDGNNKNLVASGGGFGMGFYGGLRSG